MPMKVNPYAVNVGEWLQTIGEGRSFIETVKIYWGGSVAGFKQV